MTAGSVSTALISQNLGDPTPSDSVACKLYWLVQMALQQQLASQTLHLFSALSTLSLK